MKSDFIDAMDISRLHAEDEQELRDMNTEFRAKLMADIENGVLTVEEAQDVIRNDALLAIVAMPIAAVLAILSPVLVILAYTHLQYVLLGIGALVFLARRKRQPTQSIECTRCKNMDPANLKGGKFSCTICGYSM